MCHNLMRIYPVSVETCLLSYEMSYHIFVKGRIPCLLFKETKHVKRYHHGDFAVVKICGEFLTLYHFCYSLYFD